MRFLGIFIFILSVSSSLYAQPLNAPEQAIKGYVFHTQKAQLDLLKQLVNIHSGTSNVKGVQQVGRILSQQLQDLGFTVSWVNEPQQMKRAGTLIARHPGKNNTHILLIGHLDTVSSNTKSFQHFKRQADTAKGAGIIDDKGGDVVMIYALKALHAAGQLKDLNITLVFTGDEEDSGKPTSISRASLIKIAKKSDYALDFEPALDLNSATVARRGIIGWVLETKGNSVHSADIFSEQAGDGAIFELARILNVMRHELSKQAHLTFSPGLVLGGTHITYNKNDSTGQAFGKQNVIAATALVSGDLRYLTVEQKAQAQDTIQSIVSKHLPGTDAIITFQDGIPPMPLTEGNLKLLELYSLISEDLGQGKIKAVDPDARGAADISYVAAFSKGNLSGLGPCGSGMHSNTESLNITSLPIQTERAAIFMYRLAKEK